LQSVTNKKNMKQVKKLTKKSKAKEPATIRFKKLSNGNKSIYLDIYSGGKRYYEFLKLYIIPEVTPIDKNTNKEMLQMATALKAQKIIEIKNLESGFTNQGIKQKAYFIDYLEKIAESKFKTQVSNSSSYRNYKILISRLKEFSGDKTTFKQINKEYCRNFIQWLKTAKNKVYPKGTSQTYTTGLILPSSQYQILSLFKTALKKAVKDGIIPVNPFDHIQTNETPKRVQGNREYLTIDEVKLLVKTNCERPIIKQAFLFSCFCGMRYSDIKNLRWGDIRTDNEGKPEIKYKQQKTQKEENLQISEEALKFLPDRGSAKEKDFIFNLPYNWTVNTILRGWACAAGINKRVTFHVGRHTNATLLLSLGTPIETVSKLLGHSDIQTTQIYAKVIDRNKREAVSKLDGITD